MPQKLKHREDIPQPSDGAPLPMIVGDENRLSLCYNKYGPEGAADMVVVLRFSGVRASRLGEPDETLQYTHPLAELGLLSHHAHEVLDSDWLKSLCGRARLDKHIIILFHDSTFEIVCSGFQISEVETEYVGDALASELDYYLQ